MPVRVKVKLRDGQRRGIVLQTVLPFAWVGFGWFPRQLQPAGARVVPTASVARTVYHYRDTDIFQVCDRSKGYLNSLSYNCACKGGPLFRQVYRITGKYVPR